ncbi:MAG: ATP-binding protein [Caldisericia bacterium]|nr:ATP-binding protein [Caldisericia bacterium]MDD4614718.1 ATP-binding protein [Caldisericia bacterium]
MKELVVLSGKGGTGKTSIAASFAALAKRAVLADCDVDAADLFLLLDVKRLHEEKFYSGILPHIVQENCSHCGKCYHLCPSDAITQKTESGIMHYEIQDLSCEGCGICIDHCPQNCIQESERFCGYIYLSQSQYGTLSHAKLLPGGENSGKLVSAVRKQAQIFANANQLDWIIVDGSPGIGCPVISSITGADLVLLVAEPTISGIHDMNRVISVCQFFHIPVLVCVNKADLNEDNTNRIKSIVLERNETWLGTIPYDEMVTTSQNKGVPVVTIPASKAGKEIITIWEKISHI